LVIIQAPLNGILGGPLRKDFLLAKSGINYAIHIEQMGVRKIEILSDGDHDVESTLGMYYRIITLLMLFDGEFYPVIEAMENGIDITDSMRKRALASYESADFMLGAGNALVDPFKLLSSQLINAWGLLEDELDLVHKIFLYCASSVKMPVDMKCAFLTEAYIGLAELIASKKADFVLPKVRNGGSKLKEYLKAVIKYYGAEVFEPEQELGIELFTNILRENRNRIAHIKTKQGTLILNGAESVLYLCKLSMLYRIVLFDLLEIPPELYESSAKERVKVLNQWNGILDRFIERIKLNT